MTMATPGVNVDSFGRSGPEDLRRSGARWLRVEARYGQDLSFWLPAASRLGMKILLIVANDGADGAGVSWRNALTHWRDVYGDLVDAWQLMNEPDAGWNPVTNPSAVDRAASHLYPSSWCMDAAVVEYRLNVGREVLGDRAYIVGPGLSSGHHEFIQYMNLSMVNAIAIHPYAKFPDTPELDMMIENYRAIYPVVWATEYDSRTPGMHRALFGDPRLDVACAFCWSDSMVYDFGMLDSDGQPKPSFHEFRYYAGDPVGAAIFQLGFKTVAERHPELVGTPLQNERGIVQGNSFQRTSNGILYWGQIEGVGDTKGFLANDMRDYLWDGERLVEV